MLHHISLSVSDLARSTRFYDATLKALGYVRVFESATAAGYGPPGGGDKFAIKVRLPHVDPPAAGSHVAFAATSRAAVDAWHSAALANGGADNGAPGERPHFGPEYYAAFVRDPDGWELEAVKNAVSSV